MTCASAIDLISSWKDLDELHKEYTINESLRTHLVVYERPPENGQFANATFSPATSRWCLHAQKAAYYRALSLSLQCLEVVVELGPPYQSRQM